MKNPLVSVIIATMNESSNIERIILSLKSQTYSNIEIIVVDNNSRDGTRGIAERYLPTNKVINLAKHIDLLMVKNFRGAQVNLGVSMCKGDIIFFPDADMTFDSNLIFEAVNLMKNYDALYVPEVVVGKGYFGKIRNFERSFYNATCVDAVRFVNRYYFDLAQGFDEKNIEFAPDDWDLTKTLKKIGARTSITKSVKYHHEEWLDLKTYLRKKTGYLETFDRYIEKWGKEDVDVKRQLGVVYRFFTVFVSNGKYKKILKNPGLAISMYSVRVLVGLLFLVNKLNKGKK